MKVTFLGTGTSQGVPIIGCDCEVCTTSDAHDNRLRPSILLSQGNVNLAIDAGPDFRQQMLRAKVQHLEAILITHEHNDHIIGIDDVNPTSASVPFGGMNDSGLGREGGHEGLDEYLETKTAGISLR